jgi:hypothetical protein
MPNELEQQKIEAEIEMGKRHIREGEEHIARQEQIVGELRRDGHPTAEAESLLKVFRETLASHKDHMELLRREEAGEL